MRQGLQVKNFEDSSFSGPGRETIEEKGNSTIRRGESRQVEKSGWAARLITFPHIRWTCSQEENEVGLEGKKTKQRSIRRKGIRDPKYISCL